MITKKLNLIAYVSIMAIFLSLAFMVAAFAEDNDGSDNKPSLSIAYCTLSFRDSVCIKYAVDTDNPNTKLLVWNESLSPYGAGDKYEYNEQFIEDDRMTVLEPVGIQTIKGKKYYIYDYCKLTARQMTKEVYARAFIEDESAITDDFGYKSGSYGDVRKYSILQYTYNKLGMTGTATEDESLKKLLEGMLKYGESTQKYNESQYGQQYDYEYHRRYAKEVFYQVNVENGSFADGSNTGLYTENTPLSLNCDSKKVAEDGTVTYFSYWTDENDNRVDLIHVGYGNIGDFYNLWADDMYIVEPDNFTDKNNITLKPVYTQYSENIKYEISEDKTHYTVTGTTNSANAISIAPTYDDGTNGELPVTEIADKAFENRNVTELSLPSSITKIGADAFNGVHASKVYISDLQSWLNIDFANEYSNPLEDGLYVNGELVTELNIPEGTTKIKQFAFCGFSSIKKVSLPSSLETLETSVFAECTALKKVEFAENGKLTEIKEKAFDNCTSLKEIHFPNSVTSIDDDALNNCENLVSVTIPGGIKSVNQILSGKQRLYTVVFGEGIEEIQENAFSECFILGNIKLPSTLKKIGDYAFYLTSISNLYLPKNVETIGNSAFSNVPLRNVTIHSSVKSIGSKAFFNNIGWLKQIDFFGTEEEWNAIPKGEKWDNGRVANGNCKVNFYSNIEYTISNDKTHYIVSGIGDCTDNEIVVAPQYEGLPVTEIADSAFVNCINLTSVKLNEELKTIGNYAFANCSNLETIKFSGNKTQWDAIKKQYDWDNKMGSSVDGGTKIVCTDEESVIE